MKLLEIKDLKVNYSASDEQVYALNGVNLSINKGESLGFVGETGAGKTTTALAIMKLLPERVSKVQGGSISFNEKELLNLPEKDMQVIRGSLISMIFQDPMTSLNPVLRVGDQIMEALLLHKDHHGSQYEELKSETRFRLFPKNRSENSTNNKILEERTDEILKLVGIDPCRKNQYPHEFSGGMKQRVVIAIALACRPLLLIADEPTTALDVTIQAQVLAMIEELKKNLDMSMIMITHDLGIVAETCDKIAVMYAGEIIESGLWKDFFLQKERRHPYTRGLFGSIPNIKSKSKRLSPIKGLMPDPTNLPSGCLFHPRCPNKMEICEKIHPDDVIENSHMIKCHLYKNKENQ